jgi:endonuclease III
VKRASTIKNILDILSKIYPRGEKPWKERSDPFQTTIATILSAQTTDDQVDRITPELFRRYPTPEALGNARAADVETIIKSVGLYKAKAKNIIAAGRMISEEFGGVVPSTREELVSLPGVGRKTANVVLIKSFGGAAMPVDTHVFRVTNRIGLADAKTPDKVEEQLEAIIPKRRLAAAHFWLIQHGRTLCDARKPLCMECPIRRYCDTGKKAH